MKKNVLFVIDSLDVAGAEKSLVTLLTMLDYSKYAVDLMLFGHGGKLEELLPPEVVLLPPLSYINFTRLNINKAFTYSLKRLDFRMLHARAKYSVSIRVKEYSNPQKARLFWQSVSAVIEDNPKTYETAISYAQGIPTFYVAEKVKAKQKLAWVNTSYMLNDRERDYQMRFYDEFDRIVAVSDSAKEVVGNTFSCFFNKISIIYDINNPDFIYNMAEIGTGYEDGYNGIRILTIGRLSDGKGYDIALEACKKLKEMGIRFRWYALGKGPLQNQMEDYIRKNELSDYFVLLGVTENPYRLLKESDIYVQSSRSEGFGLAIAEARMLNIPVVTTRFDAVYNQMVDGKNGIVVDMNADAVCEGILSIFNNEELRESIIKYLQTEKKGNVEELDKFYQLIE